MRSDILNWIWDRNEGHPYMATIDSYDDDKYREVVIDRWSSFLHQESPGQNLFFTPLVYDGPRSNEGARGLGVLYADLDHMDVGLVNQIPPHLWWQTGPSTTQGLWKLSAAESDYSAWADLNQRMTYYMKADKGGWAGSKLLRVPETTNYKYDPPFQGKVLSFQPDALPYEAEALRAKLPPLETKEASVAPHPDVLTDDEWRALILKNWGVYSLGTRSALMQKGARDRSTFIVGVVNKMLAEGLSKELVFHSVWGAHWNKWRTDRYRPDYLWQIINYH